MQIHRCCLIALLAGLAERRGERNPLVDSSELTARYVRRPWRWFIDAPGMILGASRAAFEPQVDSGVEAARRRYLFRRRLSLALVAVVFAAIFIIFRPS